MHIDTRAAKNRFLWPKVLPELTPEQRAISDDFMRRWLEHLPTHYGILERFNHRFAAESAEPGMRTIEVGAGRGNHLDFEDVSQQEYHCVEYRENLAADLHKNHPSVTVVVTDCQKRLPYDDGYFDRALAIHVLEHLPDLPAAVVELHRVLKPGGVLSILIPCDPGPAYWLARKISTERLFRRTYHQSYGWLYKREHINSPHEITSVLARKFDLTGRRMFPLRVPIASLNLVIGAHYRKRSKPTNGRRGTHPWHG